MSSTIKLYPLPAWTRIAITGADRQNFINNFCTNNIRTLPVGAGLEAFITDIKGHALGHGWFWALENELLFDTVPGQGSALIAHWDRYLIRERAEFQDRTDSTVFWCLAGEEAPRLLTNLGNLPAETLRTGTVQIAGCSVLAALVPWLREPAWLLSGEAKLAPLVEDALLAAGASRANQQEWNAARIAAKFPLYGQDITTENLPQEIARDKQAISFTKGCYLGQEPIARIDALGHVNKLLVGLRSMSPLKNAITLPLELTLEGKPIGRITSLATDALATSPLPNALGIVRRAHAKPGTIVESSACAFEVL
jgi:tRNA-modifying protein YgfZ